MSVSSVVNQRQSFLQRVTPEWSFSVRETPKTLDFLYVHLTNWIKGIRKVSFLGHEIYEVIYKSAFLLYLLFKETTSLGNFLVNSLCAVLCPFTTK